MSDGRARRKKRGSIRSYNKPNLLPYDPAAYMRRPHSHYHPSHHRKSRDEMVERFPENLIKPLPLEERGEMPPSIPDMDIQDLHYAQGHSLTNCEVCAQPWVMDVMKAFTKRIRNRPERYPTLSGYLPREQTPS